MKKLIDKTLFISNFRRKIAVELIILLFFSLTTFLYFWPVVTHFTSYLPGNQDELFITFAITQMARKFPQPPNQLFDSGIFYPATQSQAFSDLFITSGIIAKPFLAYFKEPVAAFNSVLLIGQILTLWGSYLLLNKLSKDRITAVLFSLIFSFSLIHLHYISHLHTFFIGLAPLSGWLLLKWIESKKNYWLYLWFLILGLQAINSPLPAYFILYLAIFIFWLKPKAIEILWENKKHVLIISLGSLILFYPYLSAYFSVSRQYDYHRSLSEVVHFSLSPEQLFGSFFSPVLYFLFVLLFLLTIFKREIEEMKIYLIAMLVSLLLSLGPVLHWMGKTVKIPFPIPLPYLLLYYIVPGFNGFRTPSRWLVMFALFAVMFSVLAWAKLFTNKKLKIFSSFVVLIFIVLLTPQYNSYVKVTSLNQAPPIYQWLRYQPQQVVVELPMAAWDKGEQTKQEIMRMYWSLYHGKKLVNGYSGYFPQSYLYLTSLTQQQFPNQSSIEALQNSGAELLLVNLEQYGDKANFYKNQIYLYLGEPNFELDHTMVYKLPLSQQ